MPVKKIFTVDGVDHINDLFHQASPDKKNPAVILIHEWWGLDDYAKERAQALADQGYSTLAIDMYGNAKTVDNPKDAYEISSSLIQNFSLSKEKIIKAISLLKEQEGVDSSKIVIVGHCFGGTMALNMARSGTDFVLVASFHGALAPPLVEASPETFKPKVLVFNGDADPYVPQKDVESFKQEMSDLKADLKFVGYKGAVHSFTKKDADKSGKKFDLPLAYNKEADEDSWNTLLKELSQL